MKAIPEFHRIGSDPEFLFVQRREFRATVVPANTVISANKQLALKSFIGTDNHAATAELRPRPSHNIGRHLYDVAYGMVETDKWLKSSKKHKETGMVAQPWLGDEPLGGHIHCSFFLDEPMTKIMQDVNRVYNGERIVAFDPNQVTPDLNASQAETLAKYTNALYKNEIVTKNDFAQYLDHLLWPFECAIQPWYDRLRRNGRYGGTSGVGDRVRQNVSYPENSSKYAKLAYLHYEYRAPSTWLCHPWLAYAYLGLAKLSMLNVKLIREQLGKPGFPKQVTNNPANEEYKKLFATRMKVLVEKGRWTKDLQALGSVIPKCFESRAAWFEVPGQPVDIEAWGRLL